MADTMTVIPTGRGWTLRHAVSRLEIRSRRTTDPGASLRIDGAWHPQVEPYVVALRARALADKAQKAILVATPRIQAGYLDQTAADGVRVCVLYDPDLDALIYQCDTLEAFPNA